MNEARTNEQYHAFQHEIQFEQDEVRKLEDRILDLMEEAESLEKNVKKAEEALQIEAKKVQLEVSETRARVAEDERALTAQKTRREQLASEVSADVLRLYEQIRRTHGGTAVAAALADRCQNCNVVFRPQFSYQVRSNEGILTCESCGLILYYEPPGAGVEDPAGDAGIVSG
jgi:predicted  nucleic acid-binding Zn-ribbon protein